MPVNKMAILQKLGRAKAKYVGRRLHLYSIGAAKTGTTSVAEMFNPVYRSAHEQDVNELNHQIIRYLEGEQDKHGMAEYLQQRDKKYMLEVESSHPLGYVAEILVDSFPKAKFIITIREPYSWLGSRLNFHHKIDPPHWREYRDYFWIKKHMGYESEEVVLEKYDLCSLRVYLSQYADHYKRVLKVIPEDRRLIIRTHELKQSIDMIARFAGVPSRNLKISHSNREVNKVRPLGEMNTDYVRKKVWEYCSALIEEFFPETAVNYP